MALYCMHALEIRDRGWAMQKPLEAERISQIEMRMQHRKAIPLSRSAYRAVNLNIISLWVFETLRGKCIVSCAT